jgi:hypothetical protein
MCRNPFFFARTLSTGAFRILANPGKTEESGSGWSKKTA